ncbi:MAG: D,D-heptose 1,7-bisphosphate phosphatase [Desulfobulbus propionicus]|nr:MAG: D,D-heptose 1,7-bisphosphate phosphatase [Desulfobulbus propionicus]
MAHPDKKAAVFLDRDGTINEQMGYINHISRFIMLPGAAEAIARLNRQKVPVVVVTNQSGLARGYFPPELLDEVHTMLDRELERHQGHIDGMYVCPHHPEAKVDEFRKACTCRKPKPGLLEQAAEELNLDLERSFVVGDRWSDIRCGATVGATTVLVLTGYGRGDARYIGPTENVQPAYVAPDLSGAVDWILQQIEGNGGSPALIRNPG